MRTVLLCLGLSVFAAGADARFAISPEQTQFGPHRFEDYAAEVYKGPLAKPDFEHGRKGFRFYRTRLTNGAADGVNFAGHWALINIGCGTGCTMFYMVDVQSGAIRDVPLGGEHDSVTVVQVYPNSSLIKAFWEDFPDRKKDTSFDAPPTCRAVEIAFDGEAFTTLWKRSRKGECPYWGRP